MREMNSAGRYQSPGPDRDEKMRHAFLGGQSVADLAAGYDITPLGIQYHLRKMGLIPQRSDRDAARLDRAKAQAAAWAAKYPGPVVKPLARVWTPQMQWEEIRDER